MNTMWPRFRLVMCAPSARAIRIGARTRLIGHVVVDGHTVIGEDCELHPFACLGGPPQHETWDPKPEAPQAIRGEFQSIATSLPDVRLCEHLPKLARLADRYTIIRSMSHDDLDHGD